MILNSKHLLIIFTRNPELGKVKSRLAADVGEQAALNIYKFLLAHTHKVTKELKVDKEVWYSNSIPDKDLWDKGAFTKHAQIENDDLGARMQYAFDRGFKKGYKYISIIGSDLYDISQADMEQALSQLENKDAVIGPATDGGFYYLGLSRSINTLFKNKKWGSNSVLEDCLNDLKKYKIAQLSAKNDVDYLSDISDIDVFKPFLHIKLEEKND